MSDIPDREVILQAAIEQAQKAQNALDKIEEELGWNTEYALGRALTSLAWSAAGYLTRFRPQTKTTGPPKR